MESTDVLSIMNILIVSTFRYKHVYYVSNGKVQVCDKYTIPDCIKLLTMYDGSYTLMR